MQHGVIVGTGFFVLVTIAALSSAISLIEPGIAWLERIGVKRVLAAAALALMCWSGGFASIYYQNVFDSLDFLTSNIMLPLGGLAIAIFVGWKYGYTRTRKMMPNMNSALFNLLFIVLRFIAPLGVAFILINGIVEKF